MGKKGHFSLFKIDLWWGDFLFDGFLRQSIFSILSLSLSCCTFITCPAAADSLGGKRFLHRAEKAIFCSEMFTAVLFLVDGKFTRQSRNSVRAARCYVIPQVHSVLTDGR